MQTKLRSFLAVAILLAGASWVHAQDDAKAILDKSMKAHGGAERINKVKGTQTKSKIQVDAPGVGPLEVISETLFAVPDKFKEVSHINLNGMQIDVATIYNGKEGWIHVNGMTMPLEGNLLDAVKDSMETIAIARLAFTGGKDFQATALGESKVNDKPVVGVKVSRKDHKDVNLYFDKSTNLLAKLEHRIKDPMSGQELNEERIILEYQDIDGMKSAKKALINRDGKKYMEVEVTEVKFPEKIDDSEFAKP